MCEVQLTTHTTHASGITLQSAAVRRKPNAFNLLHQLELERRAKRASDNTLEAWLYIDVLAFSEMFEADCRALLPGLGKQHGICGSVQDWQVGEPSGDEPVQPCTKADCAQIIRAHQEPRTHEIPDAICLGLAH